MSDEVLTSISKPFAAALASLQQGLTNAAKEISTLHENVVSKQTQHQSMLVELAQAKTKLDEKRLEAERTHSQQQQLQKELTDCSNQLDITQKAKAMTEERANKLEEQVIDVENWKQKAAVAEQERDYYWKQLEALRTALSALTTQHGASSTKDTGKVDAKDANKPKTAVVKESPQTAVVKESPTGHGTLTADSTAEAPSSFISAMDASCVLQPSYNTTPNAATQTEPSAAAPQPETSPQPETNPSDSRYKTRLCTFHQRGECNRGAKCLYAHSEQELRFNPGRYHKKVSAVAAMGFGVDMAVIGALFEEHNGSTERVLAQLMA